MLQNESGRILLFGAPAARITYASAKQPTVNCETATAATATPAPIPTANAQDQIIRQWKPRTDEALVLARRRTERLDDTPSFGVQGFQVLGSFSFESVQGLGSFESRELIVG